MEQFLGLDYPTWWFLVVGAVFSGYAILDGFDLGAGSLHLFFKKDESRRIALNAVGPVWDGNEVWLVIGGGTLFAGFPVLYGSLLSAFYFPFILFLVFLILRAISIEFRSKEPMRWWRQTWDVLYAVSSVGLAFLLGVLLGNVLQGIPLDTQHNLVGSQWFFLNPYGIAVGLLTVLLFSFHGGIYLCLKTEGRLFHKIEHLIRGGIIAFIVLFILVSLFTLIYVPHLKDRIAEDPAFFVFPIVSILAIANTPRLVVRRRFYHAFISSSVTIASLLVLVAFELYPTLLLASNDAANSITVYNAASSDTSLGIMLSFVCVGVPLIAGYTFFVYRAFWGKVELGENSY